MQAASVIVPHLPQNLRETDMQSLTMTLSPLATSVLLFDIHFGFLTIGINGLTSLGLKNYHSLQRGISLRRPYWSSRKTLKGISGNRTSQLFVIGGIGGGIRQNLTTFIRLKTNNYFDRVSPLLAPLFSLILLLVNRFSRRVTHVPALSRRCYGDFLSTHRVTETSLGGVMRR